MVVVVDMICVPLLDDEERGTFQEDTMSLYTTVGSRGHWMINYLLILIKLE